MRSRSIASARSTISTGAAPDLDFTDVRALIASLEAKSDDPLLRSAPLAIDLAVLKLIAEDPAVAAKRGASARRLWAACGLPDFRKVGPMHHARMVRRIFSYIGEGGHIPHEWFAAEVTRLDNVERRHRGARRPPRRGSQLGLYRPPRPTGSPIPPNGPSAPARSRRGCATRLHERLTQRFVDRRTAVLVRDIGARGADALPVTVAADGEVSVGPEPIGHLDRLRLPRRSVRAAWPTSACCSPPPSAAWAMSSTAAPRPCSTPRHGVQPWSSRKVARSQWLGRAMCSPGWRPAARCSSRRCGPRARSTGCRPRPARRCARGSKPGSTGRSAHHLGAAQEARVSGRRPRAIRRAFERCRRCLPTPAGSCRAAR